MTARQVFVVDESTDIPVPEINGFVLQQPRVLPEFALLDGHARAFSRSDFEGTWSLLYFGFTDCPDICPTALVEMAKLKDLLAASRPDVAAEWLIRTKVTRLKTGILQPIDKRIHIGDLKCEVSHTNRLRLS
ncbi:hypothetical protein E3V39_05435 [Gammaproteobacteria bacterium LSUCC0112]|nr:hypothetical protein E3V39_05435 [Gammaproteobacteria bacterium LSUCC0112]